MKSLPAVRPQVARHLKAISAGLGVGALVLALFNAQLLATYVYLWLSPPPKVISSQVAAISEAPIKVSPEPKLIIEKLGVDAPVIYDMDRTDEPSVQRSLQDGVLQFADSALPGQRGNVVIVGHSSNVPWAAGGYKYVFTLLHELQAGDRIVLHHQGIQYVYKVSGSKVVSPYDVSVLEQTETPVLTLITCTPLGTNQKRLIITADQISPSPATATPRPQSGSPELQANQPLPGR